MKRFFLGVLGVYLFCVGLNLFGFCPQKMRFASDDELINAVLAKYASESNSTFDLEIARIRGEHPQCCRVNRWDGLTISSSNALLNGLFFHRHFEVEVTLPGLSGSNDGLYQRYWSVSACGRAVIGPGIEIESYE